MQEITARKKPSTTAGNIVNEAALPTRVRFISGPAIAAPDAFAPLIFNIKFALDARTASGRVFAGNDRCLLRFEGDEGGGEWWRGAARGRQSEEERWRRRGRQRTAGLG